MNKIARRINLKHSKKIFTVILILNLLTFGACSARYNTDINVAEVADVIESRVPLESGYYSASDDYFDYYFKQNGESIKSICANWTVRCSNSQSSENEFGIIKAQAGKEKDVEAACKQYIESRRNAYLDAKAAYSPSEYEKYANAKVLLYEDIIVYFILSSADVKIAESAFKEIISR